MIQQSQQQLMHNPHFQFAQLDNLKLSSQQSQQFTQICNEDLTTSSNELESYCAGRSKQNTVLLNTEFESSKKSKTFLKLERKIRDKKESSIIVNIPQDNHSIHQMINIPSRFLNPFANTYRLIGDLIINEDAIKASLGLIDQSVLNNSIVPIISSINLYKAVQDVVISKNNSICNIYFRDLGIEITDWRYIVSRFESFNHLQFKKIADLIRKIGENEHDTLNKKTSFTSFDSSTQLCNNSVFSSPYIKSETAISTLVMDQPVQPQKNTKKNQKETSQFSNELKTIETEINKAGKDSLSYTHHFKNNVLTSMHFSKSFLERAGWEVSQFSMFCLYNGLPELFSYEEYCSSTIQMLNEKIKLMSNFSNSNIESYMPQVYINKVGQKIETQTKYSIVSSNSNMSIINQITNIKSDVNNKKSVNVPPQKVRGRRHFTQVEQNTLEYNLECPLNEMDRHQHRVCKFRVLHDKFIVPNIDGYMQTKTKHNFFGN